MKNSRGPAARHWVGYNIIAGAGRWGCIPGVVEIASLSAPSISVCQHVKLLKDICPWGTVFMVLGATEKQTQVHEKWNKQMFRTGHNRLKYYLCSKLYMQSSALAVLAVRQQNICCSPAPSTSCSERKSGQTISQWLASSAAVWRTDSLLPPSSRRLEFLSDEQDVYVRIWLIFTGHHVLSDDVSIASWTIPNSYTSAEIGWNTQVCATVFKWSVIRLNLFMTCPVFCSCILFPEAIDTGCVCSLLTHWTLRTAGSLTCVWFHTCL